MKEDLNPAALAEWGSENDSSEDEYREGVQIVDSSMIYAYVVSENELPPQSARPFSEWMHSVWFEFATEGENMTNRDVLDGALEDWCGGRVMPGGDN